MKKREISAIYAISLNIAKRFNRKLIMQIVALKLTNVFRIRLTSNWFYLMFRLFFDWIKFTKHFAPSEVHIVFKKKHKSNISFSICALFYTTNGCELNRWLAKCAKKRE